MDSKSGSESRGRLALRAHAIGPPAQSMISAVSTRLNVRHALQLLAVFCLALLIPTGMALAQSAFGSINGSVTDPQGAAIPDAAVTVINEATNTRQTTQTNASGYFIFPALLPATYTVAAEKQGFKKLAKTGVTLVVAQRLSVGKLQLGIGSTTITVTVSGTGTPVQTTSSQISATISTSEIQALPSLGGDYMALMRILPGSAYIGEGNNNYQRASSIADFIGIWRDNYGDFISTNGVFANFNNRNWDDTPPTMDNIQNIHVLESTSEAQYGRVEGPTINVTTKSGTSHYHGGLYYYLRNEDLNAMDFFTNRLGITKKPRYRYNTFGGSFGGPIPLKPVKNKLFFFFNFDDEPSTVPEGPRYYIMPTALERQGDFSQSYIPGTNQLYTVLDPLTHQQFPGNVIPPDRINPLMQKVLNVFPMPNFTNTAISHNSYNYVMNDSNSNPTNYESLRIDYDPLPKLHVFGRWQRAFQGSTGRIEPGISAGWMKGTESYNSTTPRYEFGATYTINSHMVNEFSGGTSTWYEKNVVPQSTINEFVGTTYGLTFPNPYPKDNPLNLLPWMSFANGPGWGYDGRFPLDNSYTGWSLSDGFTDIIGNHQLKFGIYTDLEKQVQPHVSGAFSGSFNFAGPNPSLPFNAGNSFAAGLLGYFSTYNVSTNRILLEDNTRTLEWYAQDNWRATKRLTLNYGLRFAKDIRPGWLSPGAELYFSSYNPSEAPPLYQPVMANGTRMMEDPLTGQLEPAVYEGYFVPGVGNPAPGAVLNNSPNWHGVYNGKGVFLEPRFGFAYQPFGNGKTVIRGGFGMFYSPRMMAGLTNPPVMFNPIEYYGNVADFTSAPLLLSPSGTEFYSPDAGEPYTMQWSFGIQRELGFKTVLGVTYVANGARDSHYQVDMDKIPYGAQFLPQNQDPTTGTPLPAAYYAPYPGYSSIVDDIYGNNSNYNSLQVTLNRRFAHNLTYGVAYTWTKYMDDRRGQTYLPDTLTYGVGPMDMPDRLTADWVYDLPGASHLWNNWLTRSTLDHWEISGIASFVSGAPNSVGCYTTFGENVTGGGDGYTCITTGPVALPKSERTFNRFFNTSAFRMPAQYVPGAPLTTNYIGNEWTASFHSPGENDWDLSFMKNIPIMEKVKTQLRVDMFNAFNHTRFSSVNNAAYFNAQGQQVSTALGQLNGDRGPRVMQVALRLSF